jgi:hypothetical protein
MLLYRRMLSGLPWPRHIMNVYWVVLAATYAVSQVVTFVECRPVYLYWQVVPDPGTIDFPRFNMKILNNSRRRLLSSTRAVDRLCFTQHRYRYNAHHSSHALAHEYEAIAQGVS